MWLAISVLAVFFLMWLRSCASDLKKKSQNAKNIKKTAKTLKCWLSHSLFLSPPQSTSLRALPLSSPVFSLLLCPVFPLFPTLHSLRSPRFPPVHPSPPPSCLLLSPPFSPLVSRFGVHYVRSPSHTKPQNLSFSQGGRSKGGGKEDEDLSSCPLIPPSRYSSVMTSNFLFNMKENFR